MIPDIYLVKISSFLVAVATLIFAFQVQAKFELVRDSGDPESAAKIWRLQEFPKVIVTYTSVKKSVASTAPPSKDEIRKLLQARHQSLVLLGFMSWKVSEFVTQNINKTVLTTVTGTYHHTGRDELVQFRERTFFEPSEIKTYLLSMESSKEATAEQWKKIAREFDQFAKIETGKRSRVQLKIKRRPAAVPAAGVEP